jgi:carotenoid cleavage dioxygenase-like enzyme
MSLNSLFPRRLHHANAFEDDSGQLFVDIVTYKDDAILHHLTTDQLRASTSPLPPSEVRRYHLPSLTAAEATYNSQQSYLPSISSLWGAAWYNWMPLATHTVLGHDLELPTLHPAYKTKPYTTLYGLGVSDPSTASYWDTLVKLDVTTGVRHHWHQTGCYPNEALFIPRHPTDEHDGVLVSVVLDVLRATSFLLVLDASTLTELARADVGMVIPLSLGRGSFKRRQ